MKTEKEPMYDWQTTMAAHERYRAIAAEIDALGALETTESLLHQCLALSSAMMDRPRVINICDGPCIHWTDEERREAGRPCEYYAIGYARCFSSERCETSFFATINGALVALRTMLVKAQAEYLRSKQRTHDEATNELAALARKYPAIIL